MMPRVGSGVWLLRAAVSLSVLAVVLARTSLDEVLARASDVSAGPMVAALALVLVIYLLVSVRWRTIAAALGVALPLRLAVRAVFAGVFGGQLLPSTIGQDLVRGWTAARHAGSARRAAASVVADRLAALFAACMLLAFAHVSLGGIGLPFAAFLVPGVAVAAGGLLLAFLLACKLPLNPAPVAGAVALALAIHVLGIVVAALSASAFGVDSSLRVWFSIIPFSLIACAVPVSINGWGVREAVIVALAAAHGIAAADALLVSLTLGVLNVTASLPGAYVLLSSDDK